MRAAGKDDPALKALGVNSWLAVHAIARLGATVKRTLTNTTLAAARRAQKTPLDLFGLASYAPGRKGPAAYPRWGNVKMYFLTVKDGKQVAFPGLAPISPLEELRYVR